MFEFTFNNFANDIRLNRQFFLKIIKKSLVETGLKDKHVGLSLNLVDENKIKTLNRFYRGKSESTDVLSFSFHKNGIAEHQAISAIMELGDIFICPKIAKIKARKDKELFNHKMAFLTIHGFLHLLGYDHEKSPQEQKEMSKLENKILKKLI